MIVPPTVGPLWGSETQPELRSCRETSGEHCNLSLTSCVCDCPAYCWPSLEALFVTSRRVLTLWNACTPDAGSPLSGIPQSSNFVASRRVPTLLHPFGEHCNLSLASCVYDCPADCWPSLGLGHAAGAEIHVSLHIHILCGFADDQSEFHHDHNWWKAAG